MKNKTPFKFFKTFRNLDFNHNNILNLLKCVNRVSFRIYCINNLNVFIVYDMVKTHI